MFMGTTAYVESEVSGTLQLVPAFYSEDYYSNAGICTTYSIPIAGAGTWVTDTISGVQFTDFFYIEVASNAALYLTANAVLTQDSWTTMAYTNSLGNPATLTSASAVSFATSSNYSTWQWNGTMNFTPSVTNSFTLS